MILRSFFISCCIATSLIAQNPHLSINQPNGKLVDQKIEIRIDGLDPFQEIELVAEAEDQKGKLWVSRALFKADNYGVTDVTASTPLETSSYTEADPMGLFWSMIPKDGNATSSFKCKNDTFSSKITLYVNNQLIDQANVLCYLKAPEIQRIDVRENGLVGTFFIPKSKSPLPVIITLSGSNGGLSESRAKLLASNGFAVLALGYFGVDDLPSNLENIPLEYFEMAFSWLKKHPDVDGSRIGIYGVSRGAELSLILGSIFPNSVQAIVAVVPSSVVYGGLSDGIPVHAWLYEEKPISMFAPVPKTNFTNGKGQTAENPANTKQSFIEGMKDQSAFEAAAIPVENIQCPILLISGGDDQMWPSEIYANQIMIRLKINDSPILAKHLNFPNAGHGINIPNLPIPEPTYYHPIGQLWFSMGGSRQADAKASSDSWNQLVSFFHENLKSTQNHMMKSNQDKFNAVKELNLPIGEYAITGSDPMDHYESMHGKKQTIWQTMFKVGSAWKSNLSYAWWNRKRTYNKGRQRTLSTGSLKTWRTY
ncbi:MAG: acyl-CoA thioesterase/BAAT N-terminal domain-containing protein [Chlamydiia bacterium]|nr:acyl-CoA thioesterase/BAAT N-terminal domain-containing protein [Chlamydiia bacterium]